MNWRALAAIPLVVALSACSGALREQATETWSHTYALAPGVSFEVGNTNGKVEVEGIDGSTVQVSAEKIAKATTEAAARELLAKIKINEKVTHDRVVVETARFPGLMIGVSFEVTYHVKAPRGARITVQTTNGPIALTALAGRTDAVTTNGTITGASLTGDLHLRTTNGSVRLELVPPDVKQLEVDTTNGSIRLGLPETAKASVTASCTNGRVDASGLKFDVREQSRRQFEGRLNGGGPAIDLHTINGGIRIRPSGAAAGTGHKDAEKQGDRG